MAEFIGTQNAVALQRRLQARQADIAANPDLVNGGRILHFLDPDKTGWDSVRAFAQEDRLAGFAVMDRQEAVDLVHSHLGAEWKTPAWRVFIGGQDPVLSACTAAIDKIQLPDGWSFTFHDCPSDEEIAQVQALNEATGVSPYPAYYMRSEAVPVLTTCIRDASGVLMAAASVADRYHTDCRLAHHAFAGMVSVSERMQGRGIGKVVNALALRESHARFGWTHATEQVAQDNPASAAMVAACGLDHSQDFWTVVAINSDESFSR